VAPSSGADLSNTTVNGSRLEQEISVALPALMQINNLDQVNALTT
jgi:hypothetical protein